MKARLKLVIVGSVDHGKSTLIGRLLFDTDSLPREKIEEIKKTCQALGRDLEFAYVIDHLREEREREMTIDTSQTFFKSKVREYVIIDAPGHKEFIQNMITGASLADAAILIVDGHEGVVEQTKRHAYLLLLLGLKNVIVAVNKMDKLEYEQTKFEKNKRDISEFLGKIKIPIWEVIPISAKQGDNIAKKSQRMPWFLGNTVLEALDNLEIKKEVKTDFLRLPIQDVYEIDGGKVFVGKVESGNLKKNDEVIILPEKKHAQIKKLLNFNGKMITLQNEAAMGYNIGVVFGKKSNGSLPLQKGELERDFVRGEVVCKSNDEVLPQVKKKIKASIFWLDQHKNYNLGDRVSLKCATQEIEGKIEKIEKRIDSSSLKLLEEEAKELKHTELGEVIINLEKPLVFESFYKLPELGRFVLVQNQNVVAGGIIKS